MVMESNIRNRLAEFWSSSRAWVLGRFRHLVASGSRQHHQGAADVAQAGAEARSMRRAVVKNRPATLEQRYSLLEHTALSDELFQRLRSRVFSAAARQEKLPGSTRPFYRESGRIAPDRSYFFVKPMNEPGWLFERNGSGWVVSRAEKISGRDLFVREGAPWDSTVLYMDPGRPVMPRVRSPRLGGDLLAFGVYEQKLFRELGLS